MRKIFIKLLILVLIIQTSFNLIDMMFNTSKAVTNIYLEEGENTTISGTSSEYTVEDSSIATVVCQTSAKAQRGTNSS